MGVIVKNKKWLAILLVTNITLLARTVDAQYYSTYPQAEPVNVNAQQHATALPWWQERDMLIPDIQPYQQPTQNQPQQQQVVINPHARKQQNTAVRPRPASYRRNPARALRQALNCQHVSATNIPDRCIQPSVHNRHGLQEQIRYLSSRNPSRYVGNSWANISNAELLHTARELLHWESGISRQSLRDNFMLREVGSFRQNNQSEYTGNAKYTGYFTPVVEVQSYRDAHYRYPVYGAPPEGSWLSRSEIDRGKLRNRGLEIAWTNDKVNLFFAHVQGSAIARYPNGSERFLGFAAHNNHNYRHIRPFLKKGYMKHQSLSNENIRRWLNAHPQFIDEVLHINPRYIFFRLSKDLPKTASSTVVLPGHTLAVDHNYIPLGAVLLAEIPRIDHRGNRVGKDWRLLFAQDRGIDIKGPGRIDLYTGMGPEAETMTYRINGLHRTYMLIHKQARQLNNMAEM